MTVPLPAQGDTTWYDWAGQVDSQARYALTGTKLHTDYRSKSTGALPATGDEGIAFANPTNAAAQGYNASVVNGRAVSNIPSNIVGASYINQHLGSKVNRIGALFSFGAGTTDGSITMAAWSVDLPNPVSSGTVSAHFHFVIQPTGWIYGVFVNGTFTQIANGTFVTALAQDGTLYRAELRIDGTVATLVLPDNSTATVADSRIGSVSGIVACWEFYKNGAGSCLPAIAATWADSVPDMLGAPSNADVAKLLSVNMPTVAAAKWAPTSDTQVSPPSSWAAVNAGALTVNQKAGPNNAILVRLQGWLVVGAPSSAIVWGIGIGVGANATPGGPADALAVTASSTAVTSQFAIEHLVTGLVAGTTYTVQWQHYSPSVSASNYIDVNPPYGRFALITARGV